MFSNSLVSYFLKYFRGKFREILTSGSQEVGVFPRKQFLIQLQLFWLTALHFTGFFGHKEKFNFEIKD